MDTASIFSGKALLSTLINIGRFQPAEVEQGATIAWQWLVLAAAIIWAGTLIAEWRLLVVTRGEQRPEINALLLMTTQRQRRQGWLWVSIILLGTVILFWLRSIEVLPHRQLDELPNWPLLAQFLFSTAEGWLWLARGGLAFLAIGLSTASSFSAWRYARTTYEPDLPADNDPSRRPLEMRNILWEMEQRGSKRTLVQSRVSQGSSATGYIHRQTREPSRIQKWILAERHATQLNGALAAAILFLLALGATGLQGMRLYVTTLALHWIVLLALSAWLGGTLYLASVLAPATQVIESGERTQTYVELLPAIRPSIIQAFIAISLYMMFSVEMRLGGASTLLAMAGTPFGWVVISGAGLWGLLLLLTCYQERRVLPHLARIAWLAARGTLMSVWGGRDVSRSLQIGQKERQALANLAERRFRRTLYAQVLLGLHILFCIVLVSMFAPPLTI